MEDQEFQSAADEALSLLYKKLAEAADEFEFDVDMNAGALVVEFEDPPERFVVSPNSPVHQIWVSAHVKSYKLDYDAARGSFVHPGSSETLEQLIASAMRVRVPDFSY